MKRIVIGLVIGVFLSVLGSGWISAENRTSCNVPDSYANIQAAIDDVSCDEIVVAAGFYFAGPSIDLAVDRSVTIRGAGSTGGLSDATYLNYRVLVTNDAVVTLEDLAIDAQGPEHGIELSSESAGVIADNIVISGGLGWGIYNTFGVNTGNTFATVTNSAIHGNAGGITVAILALEDSVVSGHNIHGGIALFKSGTIRNSEIHTNQQAGSTDDGAGILFDSASGGDLLIENSNIYNNETHINASQPTMDGGGIMVRRGNVTVRDSDIYNNVAARRGGGIAVHDIFDASLVVENSSIRFNVAYNGGGGISVGNTTTISNSHISNNDALHNVNFNDTGFGSGGGVYIYDTPTLHIIDTLIDKNEAKAVGNAPSVPLAGGGVYVEVGSTSAENVTIEKSTIAFNFAEKDGGGVFGREGLTLRNVTVANNLAEGDGGGIYSAGSTTFLYHVTVAGNSADSDENGVGDGGGVAGVVRTDHSLIALNEDPSTPSSADCNGGVVSLGYSLIGILDDCPSFMQTGTDFAGTTISPVESGLTSTTLSDTGGPTPTLTLKNESLAVDAGSPSCNGATEDQRSYGRVDQDGNRDSGDGNYCDLGAYEISADAPVIPTAIAGLGQSAHAQNSWSVAIALLTLAAVSLLAARRLSK